MYRRGIDRIRREPVHQPADARHVGQRVERTDLVEVDLVDRCAVDAALRVCDRAVDGPRVLTHGLRHGQMPDQVLDLVQTGVVMFMVMMMLVRMFMFMVMIMMMLVFMFVLMCMLVVMVLMALFLAVDEDVDVRPRHAALDRRLRRHFNARQAQRIHIAQKCVPVRQQLQQRRHQHIARCAHRAVQI